MIRVELTGMSEAALAKERQVAAGKEFGKGKKPKLTPESGEAFKKKPAPRTISALQICAAAMRAN
jgi:hypothetical protein